MNASVSISLPHPWPDYIIFHHLYVLNFQSSFMFVFNKCLLHRTCTTDQPMLLFLFNLQLPSSVTGRQQARHNCLLTKQMDSMKFENWILQLPFHISKKVFQKATKPGSAGKKKPKNKNAQVAEQWWACIITCHINQTTIFRKWQATDGEQQTEWKQSSMQHATVRGKKGKKQLSTGF